MAMLLIKLRVAFAVPDDLSVGGTCLAIDAFVIDDVFLLPTAA